MQNLRCLTGIIVRQHMSLILCFQVWKELSRIKNADLQDTDELARAREAMVPIVAKVKSHTGCLTDGKLTKVHPGMLEQQFTRNP